MKKLFIMLAMASAISGCSSFAEQPPPPLVNSITTTISIVDKIPGEQTPGLLGRIYRLPNGLFAIYVLKEGYPYCITHEIIHAFNWDWHKGRKSAEFCNEN